MDDLISRKQAIDDIWTVSPLAHLDSKWVDRWLRQLPSVLSTNLAEVGTDCISRQSAIDALRKLREEDIEDYGCEIPEGFNQDHLDRATFAIKQLPPIQPKRGRWINGHCSECNEHAPYWCMASTYHASNFCPMCGADMRGEQNDSV